AARLADDRDDECRRSDVLRCVDRVRQAGLLAAGHDHELPPLPVLRAAREPAAVEDALPYLCRDRRVGVRALVALRGDGEVRVHGRAPRQFFRNSGTSRSPLSPGGRRCGSAGAVQASPRGRRPRPPKPVATTVTQTWPFSRSSTVAPKMMFVSSVAAARITSAASFTSTSVRSSPPAI